MFISHLRWWTRKLSIATSAWKFATFALKFIDIFNKLYKAFISAHELKHLLMSISSPNVVSNRNLHELTIPIDIVKKNIGIELNYFVLTRLKAGFQHADFSSLVKLFAFKHAHNQLDRQKKVNLCWKNCPQQSWTPGDFFCPPRAFSYKSLIFDQSNWRN